MQLYFSPLACSMASRIALYEANAPARFIEVDPKTKRTLEGEDFLAVTPLGLVPVIRTDEGELLTENAAILQYIGTAIRQRGWPRARGWRGIGCNSGFVSLARNCIRRSLGCCSTRRCRKRGRREPWRRGTRGLST